MIVLICGILCIQVVLTKPPDHSVADSHGVSDRIDDEERNAAEHWRAPYTFNTAHKKDHQYNNPIHKYDNNDATNNRRSYDDDSEEHVEKNGNRKYKVVVKHKLRIRRPAKYNVSRVIKRTRISSVPVVRKVYKEHEGYEDTEHRKPKEYTISAGAQIGKKLYNITLAATDSDESVSDEEKENSNKKYLLSKNYDLNLDDSHEKSYENSYKKVAYLAHGRSKVPVQKFWKQNKDWVSIRHLNPLRNVDSDFVRNGHSVRNYDSDSESNNFNKMFVNNYKPNYYPEDHVYEQTVNFSPDYISDFYRRPPKVKKYGRQFTETRYLKNVASPLRTKIVQVDVEKAPGLRSLYDDSLTRNWNKVSVNKERILGDYNVQHDMSNYLNGEKSNDRVEPHNNVYHKVNNLRNKNEKHEDSEESNETVLLPAHKYTSEIKEFSQTLQKVKQFFDHELMDTATVKNKPNDLIKDVRLANEQTTFDHEMMDKTDVKVKPNDLKNNVRLANKETIFEYEMMDEADGKVKPNDLKKDVRLANKETTFDHELIDEADSKVKPNDLKKDVRLANEETTFYHEIMDRTDVKSNQNDLKKDVRLANEETTQPNLDANTEKLTTLDDSLFRTTVQQSVTHTVAEGDSLSVLPLKDEVQYDLTESSRHKDREQVQSETDEYSVHEQDKKKPNLTQTVPAEQMIRQSDVVPPYDDAVENNDNEETYFSDETRKKEDDSPGLNENKSEETERKTDSLDGGELSSKEEIFDPNNNILRHTEDILTTNNPSTETATQNEQVSDWLVNESKEALREGISEETTYPTVEASHSTENVTAEVPTQTEKEKVTFTTIEEPYRSSAGGLNKDYNEEIAGKEEVEDEILKALRVADSSEDASVQKEKVPLTTVEELNRSADRSLNEDYNQEVAGEEGDEILKSLRVLAHSNEDDSVQNEKVPLTTAGELTRSPDGSLNEDYNQKVAEEEEEKEDEILKALRVLAHSNEDASVHNEKVPLTTVKELNRSTDGSLNEDYNQEAEDEILKALRILAHSNEVASVQKEKVPLSTVEELNRSLDGSLNEDYNQDVAGKEADEIRSTVEDLNEDKNQEEADKPEDEIPEELRGQHLTDSKEIASVQREEVPLTKFEEAYRSDAEDLNQDHNKEEEVEDEISEALRDHHDTDSKENSNVQVEREENLQHTTYSDYNEVTEDIKYPDSKKITNDNGLSLDEYLNPLFNTDTSDLSLENVKKYPNVEQYAVPIVYTFNRSSSVSEDEDGIESPSKVSTRTGNHPEGKVTQTRNENDKRVYYDSSEEETHRIPDKVVHTEAVVRLCALAKNNLKYLRKLVSSNYGLNTKTADENDLITIIYILGKLNHARQTNTPVEHVVDDFLANIRRLAVLRRLLCKDFDTDGRNDESYDRDSAKDTDYLDANILNLFKKYSEKVSKLTPGYHTRPYLKNKESPMAYEKNLGRTKPVRISAITDYPVKNPSRLGSLEDWSSDRWFVYPFLWEDDFDETSIKNEPTMDLQQHFEHKPKEINNNSQTLHNPTIEDELNHALNNLHTNQHTVGKPIDFYKNPQYFDDGNEMVDTTENLESYENHNYYNNYEYFEEPKNSNLSDATVDKPTNLDINSKNVLIPDNVDLNHQKVVTPNNLYFNHQAAVTPDNLDWNGLPIVTPGYINNPKPYDNLHYTYEYDDEPTNSDYNSQHVVTPKNYGLYYVTEKAPNVLHYAYEYEDEPTNFDLFQQPVEKPTDLPNNLDSNNKFVDDSNGPSGTENYGDYFETSMYSEATTLPPFTMTPVYKDTVTSKYENSLFGDYIIDAKPTNLDYNQLVDQSKTTAPSFDVTPTYKDTEQTMYDLYTYGDPVDLGPASEPTWYPKGNGPIVVTENGHGPDEEYLNLPYDFNNNSPKNANDLPSGKVTLNEYGSLPNKHIKDDNEYLQKIVVTDHLNVPDTTNLPDHLVNDGNKDFPGYTKSPGKLTSDGQQNLPQDPNLLDTLINSSNEYYPDYLNSPNNGIKDNNQHVPDNNYKATTVNIYESFNKGYESTTPRYNLYNSPELDEERNKTETDLPKKQPDYADYSETTEKLHTEPLPSKYDEFNPNMNSNKKKSKRPKNLADTDEYDELLEGLKNFEYVFDVDKEAMDSVINKNNKRPSNKYLDWLNLYYDKHTKNRGHFNIVLNGKILVWPQIPQIGNKGTVHNIVISGPLQKIDIDNIVKITHYKSTVLDRKLANTRDLRVLFETHEKIEDSIISDLIWREVLKLRYNKVKESRIDDFVYELATTLLPDMYKDMQKCLDNHLHKLHFSTKLLTLKHTSNKRGKHDKQSKRNKHGKQKVLGFT